MQLFNCFYQMSFHKYELAAKNMKSFSIYLEVFYQLPHILHKSAN